MSKDFLSHFFFQDKVRKTKRNMAGILREVITLGKYLVQYFELHYMPRGARLDKRDNNRSRKYGIISALFGLGIFFLF